jgi:hypothetical protein
MTQPCVCVARLAIRPPQRKILQNVFENFATLMVTEDAQGRACAQRSYHTLAAVRPGSC